jgi:hypothetical protein
MEDAKSGDAASPDETRQRLSPGRSQQCRNDKTEEESTLDEVFVLEPDD